MKFWQKIDPFDRDIRRLSEQLRKNPMSLGGENLGRAKVVSFCGSTPKSMKNRIVFSLFIDLAMSSLMFALGFISWVCWLTLKNKTQLSIEPAAKILSESVLFSLPIFYSLAFWIVWTVLYCLIFFLILGERFGLYLVNHLTDS